MEPLTDWLPTVHSNQIRMGIGIRESAFAERTDKRSHSSPVPTSANSRFRNWTGRMIAVRVQLLKKFSLELNWVGGASSMIDPFFLLNWTDDWNINRTFLNEIWWDLLEKLWMWKSEWKWMNGMNGSDCMCSSPFCPWRSLRHSVLKRRRPAAGGRGSPPSQASNERTTHATMASATSALVLLAAVAVCASQASAVGSCPGVCQPNTYSCPVSYRSGLCPGPNDIECCEGASEDFMIFMSIQHTPFRPFSWNLTLLSFLQTRPVFVFSDVSNRIYP